MQTVSAAWTAEERDPVRNIVQNTQVSWKRFSTLAARTFTIGVSTIGGNDIIGINPGAVGSPGNYKYFDESAYITGLSWERGLNLPTGGLTKALAEIKLDNNSGRFTPRYMGGNSELFTSSYLPRRPVILNAGFNFAGIDQTIPQFAGLTTDVAEIDQRNKTVRLRAADYVDYFQNKYLDQEVMFTAQRTDQVLTTLFGALGMNTAQYDLDTGINIIPFGLFDKGTRYSDIIHQLVEAENGQLYQDESGIFKFENRQHWSASPYTQIQRIVLTGQVIQAQAPSEDHLINVVEINSPIRQKQPLQTVFNLPSLSFLTVPAGGDLEQFFEFQDPVLALTDPASGGANSYFVANDVSDGSGNDLTSSISVRNVGSFARAVKYRFHNSSTSIAYVTQLVLAGRVAKHTSDLYYREKDDSSVTAYQERVLTINNDYIQNASWAASYSRMILNDFSDIENLQVITIRAIPELQLGDLVSWQGRYWRIFDIKSTLDPESGFIQELTLLQRTITTYFRIGISTIGGSDKIAP
jgi:hypothetical protein